MAEESSEVPLAVLPGDDGAAAAEADEPSTDEKLAFLINNANAFFLIVNGIIVFLMQGGFAFLEAGSVRSKNTVNILIKNMLDALIGGVSYWAIGWALAYGPYKNGFCGWGNFFAYGMEDSDFASWFFQFVFAATAATIVSGSIAERVQFQAYFVYSVLITGIVYPPVTHWAWDGGWLSQLGYADFAGSGVVHLLGGSCALVACYLIEPRLGRFEDGKPQDMPGHSVPLAGLGGFILLFGFLSFNGGSQLTIAGEGDSDAVARATVNTILGACGAGLTVLVLVRFTGTPPNKWSYLATLNGALAGMVAMCGGCNQYEPWAAILIGIFGGLAYSAVHTLMLKFQLDDPLDAVAVHGGGGIIGVLCVPIFGYQEVDGVEISVIYAISNAASWRAVGVNLLGIVVIAAWSVVLSVIIFLPLKKFNMYRIDRETEFRGNDLVKHGESAYPRDAWVELQYNTTGGNEADAKGTTPSLMSGTSGPNKRSSSKYNDAFEMMPSSGKLFGSVHQMAGSMNADNGTKVDPVENGGSTASTLECADD